MYDHSQRTFACIVVLMCTTAFVAPLQAVPPDYIVGYEIREDPSDAQSDVIWRVELHLLEEDSDADSIGWEIQLIKIIELGQAGETDTVWAEVSPTVATPDGLWWVDHADLDDPQPAEFDMPPDLDGTADAEEAGDPDLDYEFEGVTPTPSGPTYGGDVAGATFNFLLVGQQNPVKVGQAERVRILQMDDPPA